MEIFRSSIFTKQSLKFDEFIYDPLFLQNLLKLLVFQINEINNQNSQTIFVKTSNSEINSLMNEIKFTIISIFLIIIRYNNNTKSDIEVEEQVYKVFNSTCSICINSLLEEKKGIFEDNNKQLATATFRYLYQITNKNSSF